MIHTAPSRPLWAAALATLVVPTCLAAQQMRIDGSVLESEVLLPVPGAVVLLMDATSAVQARTTSDDNGRFSFTGVRQGVWVLQAEAAGRFSALSVPIEPGEARHTIDLVIPSILAEVLNACRTLPILAGVVHDENTGVALPGAAVRIQWENGAPLFATTDGAGRYTFCGVPFDTPIELAVNTFGASGQLTLRLENVRAARADVAVTTGRPLAGAASSVTGNTRLDDPSATEITGTVTDTEGVAIRDVEFRIGPQSVGVSGDNGDFRLVDPGEGVVDLRLSHIGYGSHSIRVQVEKGTRTAVAISLAPGRIVLDPVVAETRRADTDARRTASVRRDVLSGTAMADAEARGARVTDITRRFPGISVLEGRFATDHGPSAGVCIYSPGRRLGDLRARAQNWCESLPVFVDDIQVADPVAFLRDLNVADFESIELLGPGDAQIRYGLRAGAAGGALVLYSRGRGPHRSDSRNPPTNDPPARSP